MGKRLLLALLLGSCILVPLQAQDNLTFKTFAQFNHRLDSLANLQDSLQREKSLAEFWRQLTETHRIPFTLGDSVAFLFWGNCKTVSWAGDMSGWNPDLPALQGLRTGKSHIFRCIQCYPLDARLDYKIVSDGNWILDPANSWQQFSGFGPNSELRMPGWVYPTETLERKNIPHGKLSGNLQLVSDSSRLGYRVQYRVYTPAGYANLSKLPVVYVTDGHEYADILKGSMVQVLDNLIAEKKIKPLLAVFIDPRNPEDLSVNRRMKEYTGNPSFVNFLADELVPAVDSAYRTNRIAGERCIVGTSLGGWNAAYTGWLRSDRFGLIGIQSPAFDSLIISRYSNAGRLPLKIFMSTGVVHDTEIQARNMKKILDEKGYPLLYREVNEGHSWGNWRALLDDMLVYFFGTK